MLELRPSGECRDKDLPPKVRNARSILELVLIFGTIQS